MFLVVHKAVLHTAQHEAKLYKRKPLVEVARGKKGEKKKKEGEGERKNKINNEIKSYHR